MLTKLIFLFIIIPFIEMLILIKLGQELGFWTTLVIIVITGVVGAALTRMEGIKVIIRIKDQLREGNLPGEELVDALLILIAGVLLITPGLLTDGFGLLILLPRIRIYIKRWVRNKMREMLEDGSIGVAFFR